MTKIEVQFYETIIKELPKISRALAGIEESIEEIERRLDEKVKTYNLRTFQKIKDDQITRIEEGLDHKGS